MKFSLLIILSLIGVSCSHNNSKSLSSRTPSSDELNSAGRAFIYSFKSKPIEVRNGNSVYESVEFHNPKFKSQQETFETLAVKYVEFTSNTLYTIAAEAACQSIGMSFDTNHSRSDLQLEPGQSYVSEIFGNTKILEQSKSRDQYYALKSFKCKKLVGYWSIEYKFNRALDM